MQLVMVMPGEDVMASSGFGKEVCHFYEKQLARVSAHHRAWKFVAEHPRPFFVYLPKADLWLASLFLSLFLSARQLPSLPPSLSLRHSLPQHVGARTKVGVAFAKGYRIIRLWGIEEEGCFPTLERSLQGPSMKKTLPRTFGPADPHFTDCRGVVLSHVQTGEKVRSQSPERSSRLQLYQSVYPSEQDGL